MGFWKEWTDIDDAEVEQFRAANVRAQAIIDAAPQRSIIAMAGDVKQIEIDEGRATWAEAIERANASFGPNARTGRIDDSGSW